MSSAISNIRLLLTLGVLLNCVCASAQTEPNAKNTNAKDAPIKLIVANDQGKYGQTVLLLSEQSAPPDTTSETRELYYYCLTVPRNVESDAPFAKQCDRITSDGDSLPLGSGQGDRQILNVYRTPEGKVVSIDCLKKHNYSGNVPLEEAETSLIYLDEPGQTPSDPLLQATVTGGLDTDDLTATLKDPHHQYQFRWMMHGRHWKAVDAANPLPLVKNAGPPLEKMRVTVAVSEMVEGQDMCKCELIGIAAETPDPLPKHGREATMIFFLLPHTGDQLEPVCTLGYVDDKPVGSPFPDKAFPSMKAKMTLANDDEFETLTLAGGTSTYHFTFDRERDRWNRK